MDRRDFLGFFLAGGFLSVLASRLKRNYVAEEDVPARFWTKV
jgi:hypothetical protein